MSNNQASDTSSGVPFIPFMTLITVFYLTWELGFNARLLDVTGGLATPDQVSSIEQWGRLISGVAATLALWGMVILPIVYRDGDRNMEMPALAGLLLITGAVTVFTVYRLERKLIDVIVDQSNGSQRRGAAHLQVVSAGVLRGLVVIKGVDLTPSDLAKPAGKTFLSLFPLAALYTPDLSRRTEAILHDAVQLQVRSLIGPPEKVYNEGFLPSAEQIRQAYNNYVGGVQSYNETIDSIPQRQASAWQDYKDALWRQHRISPDRVPRPYWQRTAADVRSRGVDVPYGWHPSDQQSFNEAIDNKVRSEADQAYRAQTQAAVGEDLPKDLSWPDFLARPSIQTRWRHALAAPDNVIAMTPKMEPSEFKTGVYEPILEQQTDERVSHLLASEDSFEDGGINETLGRHAMEALVVPPIALSFSLLGALVHTFKVFNFASKWAFPAFERRRRFILTPMLIGVLAIFVLPNSVSSSNGFEALADHTRTAWGFWGGPLTAAIRWTVQAQPIFYPINEKVRHTILFDNGFGYEPPTASAPPMQEAAK